MTEIRRRSRPRGALPEKAASPNIGECVVLAHDAIAVTVFGQPAPQGSKSPLGMEANIRTRPWRAAIKKVCDRKLPAGWDALDGPLEISMHFYFERGKTVTAPYPHTKTTYDVDKLARAMHDGLVDGGVLVDDSRVVDAHCFKRYCEKGTEPRAVIVLNAKLG